METALIWLSDITYMSELILDILLKDNSFKMSRIDSHL